MIKIIKDTRVSRRTRWGQVQIPSSAFFELCFCLYLSGTERTQKQKKKTKERQNKTQNEGEIQLSEHIYLSQHPHGNPFLGDSAQEHKWHAGQVWINSKPFFMLQQTALRTEAEGAISEGRETGSYAGFVSCSLKIQI